jgi:hypothetical protein
MSDALERLSKERGTINPFASKLDFDRWCDEVKAELDDNPHARRRFANYAATAETMYAFKSDPLDAINNAIGLVNEVALARQHTSLNAQPVIESVEIGDNSRDNKESNKNAKAIIQSACAWLKKTAEATLVKVAAGLISAYIFFWLYQHFGIVLKPSS